MSAIGYQPLAGAIITFPVAMEGQPAPQDVVDIMSTVSKALVAEKPRATLNKCFAALRRDRLDVFKRLRQWLEHPDVKQAASNAGVHWAWKVWLKASLEIHGGAKAHTAFGMDKGGNPPESGFTYAQDAAIYTKHIHINRGKSQHAAIDEAATVFGVSVEAIKQAIKELPSDVTGREIRHMAQISLGKSAIDPADTPSN